MGWADLVCKCMCPSSVPNRKYQLLNKSYPALDIAKLVTLTWSRGNSSDTKFKLSRANKPFPLSSFKNWSKNWAQLAEGKTQGFKANSVLRCERHNFKVC